jgi:hypothetical protein
LKTVSTVIKIRAKPEKVWDILTKFSDYEEWNPVMTRIIGEANLGKKIEVHIRTIKGKNRIYHPTITKFEINKELRWQGRSFLPGIFEGERIFEIKEISSEEISLIHLEVFRGIGVKLFGNRLDEDLQESFEAMNIALKARAESKI